jgi:hypothetical protein
MIMGERWSIVGDVLAVAAALLAAIADGRAAQRHRSSAALLFSVSLLWLWLIVITSLTDDRFGALGRGVVNVPIAIGALLVVLRDEQRRVWVAKSFIVLLLISAASFAGTACLWLVSGFGSHLLANAPVSYDYATVPVYAPFTPTQGVTYLGGNVIPRFLGLGREPGIGAAMLGWAYFMLPRLGWGQLRWKALVLLGMAGTQSTAGFGVFLLVLVFARMIHHKGVPDSAVMARQALGVVFLGVAAWLAVFAPVFGLTTKIDQNRVSFQDRVSPTLEGLRAIIERPLGGAQGEQVSSINLIASIAEIGIPGFLVCLAAFLLPLRWSAVPVAAVAPVLFLLLTVLLSQPAIESTVIFFAVGIACLPLASEQPKSRAAAAHPPQAIALAAVAERTRGERAT